MTLIKDKDKIKVCRICYKKHDWKDCPLKEDVKKIVIERLKTMPDGMIISIG